MKTSLLPAVILATLLGSFALHAEAPKETAAPSPPTSEAKPETITLERSELQALRDELREMRELIKGLRGQVAELQKEGTQAHDRSHRRRIMELEAQKEKLTHAGLGETHPDFKSLEAQLRLLTNPGSPSHPLTNLANVTLTHPQPAVEVKPTPAATEKPAPENCEQTAKENEKLEQFILREAELKTRSLELNAEFEDAKSAGDSDEKVKNLLRELRQIDLEVRKLDIQGRVPTGLPACSAFQQAHQHHRQLPRRGHDGALFAFLS